MDNRDWIDTTIAESAFHIVVISRVEAGSTKWARFLTTVPAEIICMDDYALCVKSSVGTYRSIHDKGYLIIIFPCHDKYSHSFFKRVILYWCF